MFHFRPMFPQRIARKNRYRTRSSDKHIGNACIDSIHHITQSYSLVILIALDSKVVRPVLQYACPVWHTNLPKYLSDNIEIIQKRALKSIFPNKGYDDILYDIGVCTLHEIRNVIYEQNVKNMQGNSHNVHHLLPEERCIHYDMRRENKYPLTKNRTNRYGKSLIP